MNSASMKAILRYTGLVIIVLICGFIVGYFFNSNKTMAPVEQMTHDKGQQPATVWTCSMHPQIKLPKFGKCPICFMDLIPLSLDEPSADDDNPSQLILSNAAKKLAQITTSHVIRQNISQKIRLSGKTAFDETKIEVISMRVMGRIDKLYVDYTGVTIRKGDHIADIYSPELVSLQQELLTAYKSIQNLPSTASDDIRKNLQISLNAAKEKLRLLGFSESEISAIVSQGKVSDHLTMYAQQSGVVIEKMAVIGNYLEIGMPLLKIADLSHIWIKLDAYESDLPWLRVGQKVEFTVEAFPGETFSGTVSFIDPVLDDMTRTVKVRVIAQNKNWKLKPGMFVNARVNFSFGGNKNNLSGKWICPMHFEIARNEPGTCEICLMPLEKAENILTFDPQNSSNLPLLIPETAPLLTGERAVVYVENILDSTKTQYEAREVLLGAHVGNYYVVKSGLSEGESVVVNGAFRLDSELQIRAKPSMMNNPEKISQNKKLISKGPSAAPVQKKIPTSQLFKKTLDSTYSLYFLLSEDLASDNNTAALPLLQKFIQYVQQKKAPSKNEYKLWNDSIVSFLKNNTIDFQSSPDINQVRKVFESLSVIIIAFQKEYGHFSKTEHYLAYCPMAFNNKGAYWLQRDKQIANPYFGKSMLRCGEIKQTFNKN